MVNKSVLSLHNVVKTFQQGSGQITVLHNLNVTFQQGSTYGITGASGAGKSTLLQVLAGLEVPTSGVVCFNNQNLASLTPRQKEQFFNKQVGLIFQLPYLIKELTVLENVILKGILEGIEQQECQKRGLELLEQLGIGDKASSAPAVLSGGQQQRVAIGRALFNKPAFLLADEPTGNLDEKTGAALIDLLFDYQKKYGMGLIISSHDQYVTQKMETLFVLKDGHLSE
jgi:ABC-type lipoprotein export system ATPase subunit